LNEEEGIGPTLTDFSQEIGPNKVILVDGQSHNRKVEIAKDLGVHIQFQDGKDKGDAIAKASGLIGRDVDYVAVTDAIHWLIESKHCNKIQDVYELREIIGRQEGIDVNNVK
jgi:hypothetical protein